MLRNDFFLNYMKSCMIRNSGTSVAVLCFLILQNYFLPCWEVGITQHLGICLWLILAFKCQLHLKGGPWVLWHVGLCCYHVSAFDVHCARHCLLVNWPQSRYKQVAVSGLQC